MVIYQLHINPDPILGFLIIGQENQENALAGLFQITVSKLRPKARTDYDLVIDNLQNRDDGNITVVIPIHRTLGGL